MEKILLFYVDDDEIHRRIVARMLANEPRFKVSTFGTAAEILARLHRGELCDVLIVDCNMPIMSGYDLVKELRGSTAFNHIRILMLTINNEWRDVAGLLAAGADEYLMKPFDREMLVNKLELTLAN